MLADKYLIMADALIGSLEDAKVEEFNATAHAALKEEDYESDVDDDEPDWDAPADEEEFPASPREEEQPATTDPYNTPTIRGLSSAGKL